MRTLYFDCFSGISGDMILGSLLDLIGDEQVLTEGLKSLTLNEFELVITKKNKNGICGTDVDVIIKEHHHNHDEHHHHRNLHDIEKIIEESNINENVKKMSKNIFLRLAQAEAKVHHTTVEEIHFHEVGATDAIVDIVGSCILIDFLAPDRIISSPLNDGRGFTKCAHGVIPVPVPAVMEIVSQKGAKLNIIDTDKELVTPTGAAVICELASSFKQLTIEGKARVGYGCGKRESERPNLLRTILSHEQSNSEKMVVETNLDDTTGEILAYTMERLFEQGALDVWFESIYMKKNRPAYKLSFICNSENADELKEIVLFETSAIGVREYSVRRTELERSFETVQTEYGKLDLKNALLSGQNKTSIEYESAKELAKKNKIPLREIYKLI